MVRQGLRILAFVVLSVATAVALAPNSGSAATGGDPPTWTVINPPRMPLGDPFQAMSCPDPAHCWATDIQGGIYGTSDGGANWYQQYGLGNGYNFWSIECPTVENCVAAAPNGTLVWTDDSGAIWTTSSSSPSLWGTTSLSCPSATVCYAGGAQRGVAVSTDGGQTWTPVGPTSSVVSEISCPAVSVCYGVSDYGFTYTTDGGATWNARELPSSLDPISQLTCPTTTTCIALSTYVGSIFQTMDGGASWQQETAPIADLGYTPLQRDISCPSSATCYISAVTNTAPQTGVVLESTDGGNTWTSVSLPANDAFGVISCPTVIDCYVDSDELGPTGANTVLTDVGPVTSVTANPDPATVGAVATVASTFRTTDIGALGPGGSIVFYAPEGGAFPSDPSDYTVTDGTGARDVVGSVALAVGDPYQVTVTLSQSGITDDDAVAVTVAGFTNPTRSSQDWTLDISTSADPMLAPSAPVTVNAGPVFLPSSSVVATPGVVPPDGSTSSAVVVSLLDGDGNGVPDTTVSLAQGATHAVITPVDAVTDWSGQALFTVTDTTAEVVPLTATDTGDGIVVGTTSIFFGGAVPTAILLSSTGNPAIGGEPVTFTAAVSPVPDGGSVAFTADGVPISGCDDVPVDALGAALCTTAGLAWGTTDTIVADYTDVPPAGAVAYAPSTATLHQFVEFPASTPLPDATTGAPYAAQLPPPTTVPARWRKIRGSLPRGISLEPTGLLTGTPTAKAVSRLYSFTARATYHAAGAGRATAGGHRSRAHAIERFTLTVLSSS